MGHELLLKIIWIFILSLMPSFEGRYALIVGISLGLSPLASFIVASLGVLTLAVTLPNLLPLIDKLMIGLTGRHDVLGIISRTYVRYVGSVRVRSSRYVKHWGYLGLIVFVAIPFPATGVWTGSIAAYIFGFERSKAITALAVGGLISNLVTLVPTVILLP